MEEKQPIIAWGAGASSKLVFDHGWQTGLSGVRMSRMLENYITRIDEMIERKREFSEKCLHGCRRKGETDP